MAGHLIRRLNQISVSIFTERMAAAGHDITAVQYAALSAIKASAGIDQATLAGQIAYDRATIGGVVDRLVQKGLVDRQVSRKDRRARELRLTEAGETLVDKLTPLVWALQRDILGGLSDEEAEQILALLKKATEAGNELSRAPLRL